MYTLYMEHNQNSVEEITIFVGKGRQDHWASMKARTCIVSSKTPISFYLFEKWEKGFVRC